MARSIDLSGLWLGSYSYPSGEGPTTPFMAKLVDADGRLSGETVEPNMVTFVTQSLEAYLVGHRSGAAVDFTKTYDGRAGVANAIDYVGRLSADGNAITGVWTTEGMDGTFEMYREAVWEETVGKEAEVVEL